MKKSVVVFFLFGLFSNSIAEHLPSIFKVCKRSDANFDGCVTEALDAAFKSLKDGLPEFKFAQIDPIKVPSMTIGEGTGAVHVVQKYKNIELHGLTKGKVINSTTTFTDKGFNMEFDVHFDDITQNADYDFNGRVLVLPMVGNGKCTLKLKDVITHFSITAEVSTKNGVEYALLKDLKLIYNPKKVEYDFQNLFNGDERLGTEMNKVLNENWKEVFEDVKKGYEEIYAIILKNTAETLFKKVPYNEIFPQ